MSKLEKVVAILVAGGRGTRAGTAGPKQWQPLRGRRVADWTIKAFANHPAIHNIVVVHHRDDLHEARTLAHNPLLTVGGDTRAHSVRSGLAAAHSLQPTHVLIHDMARPCVNVALLDRCIAALANGAAAPALPVADALWLGRNGTVERSVDRTGLFRAQTPQCFEFQAICDAHEISPPDAKDDVEVALVAGLDITIVEGCENNLKITYPDDFERAEQILGHL